MENLLLSLQHCDTPLEVVATITAAIAFSLGKSPAQFSIVSIQREEQTAGSAWVQAGRKNLLNKHYDLAMRRRER